MDVSSLLSLKFSTYEGGPPHNYGKPDYQASEMVIGESEQVMGIKDDA